MKLFKTCSLCAAIATASVLISAGNSFAQNTNHSPSNLVLTVQSADAAETDTVMASLGTQVSFRDAAAGFTSFGNLNSVLTSAYGASWASFSNADLTDALYFGAAATQSLTAGTGINTDGSLDPRRTIYFTRPRLSNINPGLQNSVATSFALSGAGDGQFNTVNSRIFTMQNVLDDTGGVNGYTTAAVVSPESISQVDDQNVIGGNSYANLSTTQGTLSSSAFSFGGAGNVILALDLYRMTPRGAPAGEFGPLGSDHVGYFLGNLTLADNGDVGFIAAVPEPTTTAMLGLAGLLAFAARRRRALQS